MINLKYFETTGTSPQTFVLFHGTGGNEFSLLALTGELDAQASIVSFLGNNDTGEHRRYFAPLQDGKLDRQDFDSQVESFLKSWDQEFQHLSDPLTFIGYSNGANFILGLLEKRPEIADSVFLLHPSNLDYHFASTSSKTNLWITAGAQDRIAPPGSLFALSKQLESFASVNIILLDGSHGIDDQEIMELKTVWKQFKQ